MIPGGVTPFLQRKDIHFIFVLCNKWKRVAHEWEDANAGKKLSIAQQRILLTKFCARAWELTLQSVDPEKSFTKLRYLWPKDDGSHIQLRALRDYKYNPDADLTQFARPTVRSPLPRGRNNSASALSVTFRTRFAEHVSCILRLRGPGMWVRQELGSFGGVH